MQDGAAGVRSSIPGEERMKRGLTALVALVACFASGTSTAGADPASASSGAAYGLAATGLLPISPIVTAAASPPPDEDVVTPPTLLTVPLGGLALSGTVGADAHAHQADDLQPVTATLGVSDVSDPAAISNVNAQALAKTEGLGLLFNAEGVDPVRTLLSQLSAAAGGLLTADAVVAEAVAKCVDNQPVFETGFTVAELGGLLGGVLNDTVQQLLALIPLLLGPDAALSSIISIEFGRVSLLPDGVAIDGKTERAAAVRADLLWRLSAPDADLAAARGILV
jgi:hypothetical protein